MSICITSMNERSEKWTAKLGTQGAKGDPDNSNKADRYFSYEFVALVNAHKC